MLELKSFRVLDLPISITNLADACDRVTNWAADGIGRFVCVRDVASLMVCIDDPDLRKLNEAAAMVVPDGMPLVWIGKSRGLSVERTCGPDLFDQICKVSPERKLKHYFYGGKDGVADNLAQLCCKRYPGIEIVGTECPPFRPVTPDEDSQTVARIFASGADIVWVGMSSPKQDRWMRDHYQLLPQTLIGIGAAFDFHSGEVRRAPKWMQRSGLEFLYRLVSEPRRLWRRYLILAPLFVWRVAIGWEPSDPKNA